MLPEKSTEKPKTNLPQNFTISPDGKIVKDGQTLPSKSGIAPCPKPPKK